MTDRPRSSDVTRRDALGVAAMGMAAAAWPAVGREQDPMFARGPIVRRRGNVRHSLAYWCLQTVGWSVEDAVRAAVKLGCPSVELVDPSEWDVLERHGLTCAIALNGMPGAPFVKGLNNLAYHDEVIARTKTMIDACGESNGLCTQVIAFTGYAHRDADDPTSATISREEGAESCVKGLRALGAYAAPKGVTISIEMLNTRDDTHPMKGHPGYQGDDLDYVAEIVRRADMPNVRLLFDVYHVQIMNGDLIRRLREHHELISHVHTAGVPGRGELHLNQEVDYTAVMRTLVELGYEGYVGHEFIPTEDPAEGLRRAVEICDV